MNPRPSLSSLIESEEKIFCLMEPDGPIRAEWGAGVRPGGASLSLQKFHHPRPKNSGELWRDFPDAASWMLASSGIFTPEALPEEARPPWPRAGFSSDRAAWLQLCGKIEAAIRSELIQKAVPAREISCPITGDERGSILRALPASLFGSPLENAFRFLVKSGQSVFFGATPELLFRRENGKILVPAIAGTSPRPAGLGEAEIGAELLASRKERDEHDWVVKGVLESLRSLGLEPSAPPEPTLLRVPRLLHLYTPITAADRPEIPGETLISALHPTPAIGGLPRAAAADLLYEHEPWDRGLFSAPLLFRFAGREICLVAIRSGLLARERLHFFAGAGYVKASHAEAEWDETERKLQVMPSILFGEPHGRT